MSASSGFTLNGGNAAFANKQKLLFDQLSIAEKNHNKDRNEATPQKSLKRQNCSPMTNRGMKKFRGKESIFKRPEVPRPKTNIRVIPDYHRNPQKWTKYSLDDCPEVTENSNSQAAFAFLNELKAREKLEDENEDMELDDECDESTKRNKEATKIQFKKKSKTKDESTSAVVVEKNDKPIFRNSKIIMPECVVGEKPKKTKQKKSTVQVDINKQIKLIHLDDDDDDDDDDDTDTEET